MARIKQETATVHGGVETVISGVHLLDEHGRKRQGRVLRPRARHAWPDPDETLPEADCRRLHVAWLFACGHPRNPRMDMCRNEEGNMAILPGYAILHKDGERVSV